MSGSFTLDGPHGPMITYERSFLPEESVLPPLRIQTDAEFAVIDRMAPTFNIPLTISLALLALALIAAAALQVLFGLRPMSRLEAGTRRHRFRSLEQAARRLSFEVQPLVDDLNNLIEINAQMVLRARAQAGNSRAWIENAAGRPHRRSGSVEQWR